MIYGGSHFTFNNLFLGFANKIVKFRRGLFTKKLSEFGPVILKFKPFIFELLRRMQQRLVMKLGCVDPL